MNQAERDAIERDTAAARGEGDDDLTHHRSKYCGNRLAIVEVDLYGRTWGYCEFKWRQASNPDD